MASKDLKGYLDRWDTWTDPQQKQIGQQSAYSRYKSEYQRWLQSQGLPVATVSERMQALPKFEQFVQNPEAAIKSFEAEAPGYDDSAEARKGKQAPATPVATPPVATPDTKVTLPGTTVPPPATTATPPAATNPLTQTGNTFNGLSSVKDQAGYNSWVDSQKAAGRTREQILQDVSSYNASANNPSFNFDSGLQYVDNAFKSTTPAQNKTQLGGSTDEMGQSIMNAEYGYGVGDDFAKWGPQGTSPDPTGGRTWKPGYIQGQEAERRYQAGDQYFQYIPEAFKALNQSLPSAPNMPVYSTYGGGNMQAGQFAKAGGVSNTGLAYTQTPQTSQQTMQGAAQFTPYLESKPYQYSNWQRPQTGRTTVGQGQTPTSPTDEGVTGTSTGQPKTKLGYATDTSLAATGTQPQTTNQYGSSQTAQGGYGTQRQQAPSSYQGYSGSDLSGVTKQKQGQTNPLTSLFNVSQGQGTLQNAANYYGAQTEGVQNPYVNTGGAQKYSNVYDTNANNTAGAAYGLNQTARAATNPGQVSNAVMEQSILGQVRNTTGDTGLGGLLPTITGAIQTALAPKDQYNKELSDKLYADATRRVDEDTNRQIENIRKQYNAYGLGGSSAESEALRQLNDAAAEKKLSAQRNVDTQMLQNAQQYGNTQLTQLANILGTVGGQQNATSKLGLDLLGTQQNQYGLNQQDLSRQSDVYNTLAQFGLQNTNQATDLSKWAAEQQFAGTQAAANTGLQKAQQGYQMQQGADTSAQNWQAASQKAQEATLAGNIQLAQYWDSVAAQEQAKTQQAYQNATNEAMTNYNAQQQNFQNLQTLLGLGGGLYEQFAGTGYDQMRGNLEDIANLAGGWKERAQMKNTENSWWQPVLNAAMNGASAYATGGAK